MPRCFMSLVVCFTAAKFLTADKFVEPLTEHFTGDFSAAFRRECEKIPDELASKNNFNLQQ